ncbi:MAG: NUDIX domain-containing protein [Devosia sp.]|uniref:NUDIX domain-containing protein n=1 Tax=Devosia sp. TaxID=1871048 RepID=UPI0024C9E11F|nr:NUDIX domain-containing protein [Devosia sp.]UYN98645.1 MAG: NUDIX domain-containing protein [Devosia sp.]
MTDRVKIVATEELARNWGTLSKTTIDYRRRDGQVQRFDREVYDHGNAAAMLLHDPGRDTVLMVRQFRYPAMRNGDDADMLEACAGLLDGDAPEIAAAREALEETGHAPRDIRHVCDIYASPGSLTEKVSLYIGTYDATTRRHAGGGIEAEGEEIEVVEIGFAAALAMVSSGAITDAKTVVLIQHLALLQAGLVPG